MLNLTPGVGLDPKAINEGRWFSLDTVPGLDIRLRWTENKQYQARRTEVIMSLGLTGEEGAKDVDADEIEARLMAECVIVDWRGTVPTDADTGEPLPYTPEAGFAVLRDERYPHVRAEIVRKARTIRSFREEVIEDTTEEAGNS